MCSINIYLVQWLSKCIIFHLKDNNTALITTNTSEWIGKGEIKVVNHFIAYLNKLSLSLRKTEGNPAFIRVTIFDL